MVLDTLMFTFALLIKPYFKSFTIKFTYCNGDCTKRGGYKSIQRHRCKTCGKYRQSQYTYSQYTLDKEKMLVRLVWIIKGI